MKTAYIYCLICPKINKPKYIGQTVRKLSIRLKEHKYKRGKKSHKQNWIISLENEGLLEQLKIFCLGEYSVEIINEMEIYWINFFKSLNIKLTNTITHGFGGYRVYSAAVNKRRSDKLKGIKKKPLSEKQKQQLSEFWKGNKNRLGKFHSNETKLKISNSKKGTIPHNIKKIYQYDLDMNFIKEWNSAHDAAKSLKLSQGNISTVANNKRKKCGNYIWSYERR